MLHAFLDLPNVLAMSNGIGLPLVPLRGVPYGARPAVAHLLYVGGLSIRIILSWSCREIASYRRTQKVWCVIHNMPNASHAGLQRNAIILAY